MDAGSRRPGSRRWLMFNAVGAVGLLVQLGCLWVLREGLGLHYLAATFVAIELTLVHNFFWHIRWTWADRPASTRETVWRLGRFNLANGAISLVGNLVLTAALVELLTMHYLVANVISIGVCSLLNFAVSDVVIFRATRVGTLALLLTAAVWTATVADADAADLHADTVAAFERYVQLTEIRMDGEAAGRGPFLQVEGLPEPLRQEAFATLGRGEIVVQRLETHQAGRPFEFPEAMCHHWVGTVFAEGAGLARTVALMQAYDSYRDIYRPAVRRSKTLSGGGNRFRVYLQLFMKKVVGVVLNTEYDVRYVPVGPKRMLVRSYSTRIAEVQQPDTPDEHESPVGRDNGFLWRFYNYCTLEERDGGTFIQCESVSLSRNIPTGLGWLIGPFVRSVPRESLEFTLGTLRATLAGVR